MKNQIYPCLWFDGQAREAAEFYCSVFPNSGIVNVLSGISLNSKMLKMKKISKVLFIVFAILSCNRPEVEDATPECVVNKIKAFNDSSFCSNAKVDEYTFQSNKVYIFEPGDCGADLTTEVLSADCTTLGYLGGIAGNTKINGVEFSTATFTKTIWMK
ncbi:MAG: DUF6970 domain-containing protein [Bacteroidota bacterium]